MKKLACDVDCPGGRKILFIDMESGGLKVLAEKYDFASFSPDGEKVLANGEDGMAVISVDGEILAKLVQALLKPSLKSTVVWNKKYAR